MIIHSFTCQNFYSFKGLTLVDFDVVNKAPKNDGYFESIQGRASKIEAVIGPNASGKTNLLKVLPFIKWLIIDSYKLNPTDIIPIKKFLSNADKQISLSVKFEIDSGVHIYNVSLSEEKIISEELFIISKTQKQTTRKIIFSRAWDDEKKRYILNDKKFGLSKELAKSVLRSNASIISVAKQFEHQKSLEIVNEWQKVESNVIEAGWIGDNMLLSKTKEFLNSLDFYSNNEVLKGKAEKMLARFDLGLESFRIEKNDLRNTKVVHIFGAEKHLLNVWYESSGTQQLFVLLKTILQVLDTGGIAILDEIDVNLHPDIINALCNLFVQPETNIHNAQLLFSTHTPSILSRLDKYQIILVEKRDGTSESWRLDSMEGIRSDENYYAKYMSGAYDAIPKL